MLHYSFFLQITHTHTRKENAWEVKRAAQMAKYEYSNKFMYNGRRGDNSGRPPPISCHSCFFLNPNKMIICQSKI